MNNKPKEITGHCWLTVRQLQHLQYCCCKHWPAAEQHNSAAAAANTRTPMSCRCNVLSWCRATLLAAAANSHSREATHSCF